MVEVINKFNNSLLTYYKDVMSNLKFVYTLKNFLNTMDIKILYPLLDYDNNKLFSDEFKNKILECKNETEKKYLDFSKYDNLISSILKYPYFENLDEKEKKLVSIKDDYEYGTFDYSFLTKFMMDRNFSISEINIVLTNYKPNKKVISKISFDESLEKVELSKRTVNIQKKVQESPVYIEVSTFIHSNYILYEKYINNPKFSSIFTVASNYIVDNNYTYEEPIFISLFLSLLQKYNMFEERLKDVKENDEKDLINMLDNMKMLVLKLSSLNIQKTTLKSYNVINSFGYDIPKNLYNSLSLGELDYLSNIYPLKLSNIKDYVVRVNTRDGESISYIEVDDNIYVISFAKKEDIINKTINFYNEKKSKIDLLVKGEGYAR